jgi:predicted nucleic acid-binding protein
MPRRVLDTNILLDYWNHRVSRGGRKFTVSAVRAWANDLITLHNTNAILTPIYIELIAGTTTITEASLWKAFLDEFHCIDEQRILAEDWNEAIRIASRIPRQTRRRKLGDCLIRAICKRRRYELVTHDKDFRF